MRGQGYESGDAPDVIPKPPAGPAAGGRQATPCTHPLPDLGRFEQDVCHACGTYVAPGRQTTPQTPDVAGQPGRSQASEGAPTPSGSATSGREATDDFSLLGRDADQRVGWQFWRWPAEIRRLRRSQLGLLRRLNAMHLRAGRAEGWITEDGDALIDMTRVRGNR